MSLATNARLSDCIKIDYTCEVAEGDHDGTAITMVDMKGWDGCLVLVLTAGGSTINATDYIANFKIVSNSASDGSGTDHDIAEAVTADGGETKTLTGADMYGAATATPAAGVNDKFLALDVRNEQLYAGDRYIAAVTVDAGTLEIVIVYIRYRGNYSYKDMLWSTRYAFQYNGDL